MRDSPSQTATVSLPADMLDAVDAAARALSATRSELVRAALRDFLKNMAREEALLTRVRTTAPRMSEEELANHTLAARRARRQQQALTADA